MRKNIITILTTALFISTFVGEVYSQMKAEYISKFNYSNSIFPDVEYPPYFPSLVDFPFNSREFNHNSIQHTQNRMHLPMTAIGTPSDSVQVEWVKHYASGLMPGDDCVTDMTVDNMGFLYVTGYSVSPAYGFDYLTVKYSSSGAEVWRVRYDTQWHGDDVPFAITIDHEGNIYVTGESQNPETDWDYATVKYDSSGIEKWAIRYDGPINYLDRARDIGVDGDGNVYVTGMSYDSGSYYDYTTIKYTPDGIEDWVVRYSGTTSSMDEAYDLVVLEDGRVAVTGYSSHYATGRDYATVMYNSDGIQQWVARYNGPENGQDEAYHVAADTGGNVFVTGRSKSSGTGFDYATIKYDSLGIVQWITIYDGPSNQYDVPTDIAVDDSGNVYVTGSSNTNGGQSDFATLKYRPDGVEEWIAYYNGSLNSIDIAGDLELDGMGNVYVTGISLGQGTHFDIATVKYSNEGVEEWVVRYNGSADHWDEPVAVILDGDGSVFVSGWSVDSTDSPDYLTIKYDPEGNLEWTALLDGYGNSSDVAVDIAIDPSDNVYVTGLSSVIDGSTDFLTIKYGSDGMEEWTARYDRSGSGYDVPEALTIDRLGNVYVTGRSNVEGASWDYLTIKYTTGGVEEWADVYNSVADKYDYPTDIEVDLNGNVYVTGCSKNIDNEDFLTIKYDSDGIAEWIVNYNGMADGDDCAYALAVDKNGNAYVTGRSYNSGSSHDYITIKYSRDGIEEWVVLFNGPLGRFDTAMDIAVNDSGNVYVTGRTSGSGSWEYGTIKYDSSGAEQWVALYNGPANSYDMPVALKLDNFGNVYVTGTSNGSASKIDIATIKYNWDGTEEWVSRYEATGLNDAEPRGLVIDNSGSVYVTGKTGWGEDRYDFLTIKYDTVGVQEWVMKYRGFPRSRNEANGIVVDGIGNVYVTGFTQSNNLFSWGTFTTIKYIQIPEVSIGEEHVGVPNRYHLSQSFPNPFNTSTTISYSLPKAEEVLLVIFNLMGEVAVRLVDREQPAGYHQVRWDASNLASGIYFYRLQAGVFIQTRKMLLLK